MFQAPTREQKESNAFDEVECASWLVANEFGDLVPTIKRRGCLNCQKLGKVVNPSDFQQLGFTVPSVLRKCVKAALYLFACRRGRPIFFLALLAAGSVQQCLRLRFSRCGVHLCRGRAGSSSCSRPFQCTTTCSARWSRTSPSTRAIVTCTLLWQDLLFWL